VPIAVAVIEIELLSPVTPKLTPDAKPTPPGPFPVIVEEVTLPAVVKAAPTFTPLLPPVPPKQLENKTGPPPVKTAPRWTPWLAPVFPPVPVRVTRPEVTGDQGAVRETPCDPATVATLVPDTEIVPELLVITLAAVPAIWTPKLAAEAPVVVPVKEIAPPPTLVAMVPTQLIPCEAELLGPPVPLRVIDPPPDVPTTPPLATEIPWQTPVVPMALAVSAIFLFTPDENKLLAILNPLPLIDLPWIFVIPVMLPDVVTAPSIETPWPAFATLGVPKQSVKTRSPGPNMKIPVTNRTPLPELVPPVPERVMVPLVKDVQLPVRLTP
jgi:hypothetical protein